MGKTDIPVGRLVACDWCGKNLTEDHRPGGLLFQSYAVGPCCADEVEAEATANGEEQDIRARCTPGMAFADWVRTLRAGSPGGSSIQVA